MAEKKITLGQAIDQIIGALELLDQSARQTAIDAACSHLEISAPSSENSDSTGSGNTPTGNSTHILPDLDSSNTGVMDIRTFKIQKNPSSAVQMACVVAYYLQELAPKNERKKTVTAKDLEKYFKQAKFRLPKTISQLLPDARISGYFDSASGKGEYSLNAVGYNLVVHNLPKKKLS